MDKSRVVKAYQALLDLGVALVEQNHHWTKAQRLAWQRAENALRDPQPKAQR